MTTLDRLKGAVALRYPLAIWKEENQNIVCRHEKAILLFSPKTGNVWVQGVISGEVGVFFQQLVHQIKGPNAASIQTLSASREAMMTEHNNALIRASQSHEATAIAIRSLVEQNSALLSRVSALEAQNAQLFEQITSLQTENSELHSEIAQITSNFTTWTMQAFSDLNAWKQRTGEELLVAAQQAFDNWKQSHTL